MDRLTENDRGTFIVKTQSSTHLWIITDDGVTVERRPDPDKTHHWTMHDFPSEPYYASPQIWPVVGQRFYNVVNGGASDPPWTVSSTIRSIEKVA